MYKKSFKLEERYVEGIDTLTPTQQLNYLKALISYKFYVTKPKNLSKEELDLWKNNINKNVCIQNVSKMYI